MTWIFLSLQVGKRFPASRRFGRAGGFLQTSQILKILFQIPVFDTLILFFELFVLFLSRVLRYFCRVEKNGYKYMK